MNPRIVSRVLASTAIALTVSIASAAEAADSCESLYQSVQDLDASGRVIDARKAAGRCMNACSQESGKEGFRVQCEDAYKKAERDTPSVVFEVLDATGAPTTDASVARKTPEGVIELTPTVDPSKSFSLDPTIHTFVVTLKNAPPGTAPKEVRVQLARGQQNTPVRVSFKPDTTAPTPTGPSAPSGPTPPTSPDEGSKGGIPAWAWVVGGIGIVSAGVGGALLGVYVDGDNEVQSECANVAAGTERYDVCQRAAAENNVKGWLGGIFTGVGGVGLIVGIVGIATAPKAKPKTARIEFVPVVGPDVAVGLVRGAF